MLRLKNLYVKRLTPEATLPTFGSDLAIGLDLYASENCILYPGERSAIRTGIAIAVPVGYYGRVAPRSGLALNHGLDVLAGVIDADYRGEVKIILINLGDEKVSLKAGNRIAQLVLERADLFRVTEIDDLSVTDRGAKGYGSTGA